MRRREVVAIAAIVALTDLALLDVDGVSRNTPSHEPRPPRKRWRPPKPERQELSMRSAPTAERKANPYFKTAAAPSH